MPGKDGTGPMNSRPRNGKGRRQADLNQQDESSNDKRGSGRNPGRCGRGQKKGRGAN